MLTAGDVVGLLAVYAYVSIIVLLAAILKARGAGDLHRKIIHIAIGNIVFFWWVFDTRWVMAFLAAAPFIPLLILVSPYSPVRRLRNSFLGQTTGESHGLGLVFYAISWTILAFLFFEERMLASIGIVAMSYGDGFGGMVGKRYGKRRIWLGKSLEGTLGVFVATAVSCLVVFQFYALLFQAGAFGSHYLELGTAVAASLLVGGFVAVAELLTPGGIDNLVIPLSSSALLILLGL